MENKNIEQIKSGLTTAFIDQSNNSNLAYRPEFVYNDYKQGKESSCFSRTRIKKDVMNSLLA